MKKPNVYQDLSGYRPNLSVLMACYGNTIKQNPKAWLFSMSFSESELRQYPDIARALGHTSAPMVINFNQQRLAA